jgi:arylsulfatase A-like enzyme
VLVVVIDTLRRDAVSAYGGARKTTPQIDALAQQGVRFDDVTAPASWTWPSHASLFTGLMPWDHGAHAAPTAHEQADGVHFLSFLDPTVPTLAETLHAAGYRTEAVVVNPLLGPTFGLVRGFDHVSAEPNDGGAGKAAQAVIADADPRPLFLFVNLFAPHGPYLMSPAPWAQQHAEELTPAGAPAWLAPYLVKEAPGVDLAQYTDPKEPNGYQRFVRKELAMPPEGLALLRDLYDGEVLAADYVLHGIVNAWAGRPGAVLAVTSDHGEYFGEHGLLEHGRTLYSEVTAIPLVLVAPGRLPAGKVVSTPVQLQDLFPTVLDLAGVSATAPTPDAHSLLPVVDGAARPGPILAGEWPDPFWAHQVGGPFAKGWRLCRDGDLAAVVSHDGSGELYDLKADRGMTHDLAADHAADLDRLRQLCAHTWQEHPHETHAVDAAELERLQALGYVDPAVGNPTKAP